MTQLIAKRTDSSNDNLELAYWISRVSDSDNRYLLMIHGGASNHTRWSEFIETTQLNNEWNLICPDMRGNGESMTRGQQDLSAWCADLLDILTVEKAESAVIAGHSLGAQIAIHFAARHPDKTRGLILIDPIFQNSLQGRTRMVRRYRWLFQGLAAITRGLNALGLHRRNIQDRDLRELDRETREAIRDAESFEAIAKHYGALGPILRHMPTGNYIRQALASVIPLPPLDGIGVPVLTLLSGGTTLANLDLNRQEVTRFPDSEIVTLKANHWPLTETPDDVREAIEIWVSHKFGPSAAAGK